MRSVNDWLAVKITNMVGSMWCAYIFVILAILGFPYGSASLPLYVQWLSQTFIQLVMLSVIMVGQRLLSVQQDAHGDKLDAVHQHFGIDNTSDRTDEA